MGVGDKLVVRVVREPQWSDSVLVNTDGDVVLPRIGRLRVAGLTPSALRDTVQGRLAFYLRDPATDVVVLRRVAVLGAVNKPEVLFVDPTTSLREVIAFAGGLAEDADPNRVEIVRDGVTHRIGKWRVVAESAAPIQSGDQVVVGRRHWLARNALTTVSSLAVAVSVLITAFK